MPSPSPIPPPSSYPNSISSSAKTRTLNILNFIPFPKRSARSSYWPHSSNINQLGSPAAGRFSDSSSRLSDLTEESLEAHNRRHAPILHHHHRFISIDEMNSKCSPYYKGLTDNTRAINRERVMSSPGRESRATTVATSSSFSSLLTRMQRSSCFSFKSKADNYHTTIPPKSNKQTTSTSTCNTAAASSLSSTTSSTKTTPIEIPTSIKEIEMNLVTEDHTILLLSENEKPLRERVSEHESLVVKGQENKLDAHNQNKEKERDQFTWANKYQPETLKDFICNRDKVIQLQDLVKERGCRHFIFEGPPGVGKGTMIRAMLREASGPKSVQTREVCRVFELKGERIGSIQVNMKESSQHVEVNLSDLQGYEKHVIVELMKETQSKVANKTLQSNPNSRAIVLGEADKLSTDALLYIRWLLDRYKGLNKVFFCCSDVSKLQPIESLCTVVQLLPPSKQEIVEVLEFIAKQEGIGLPHELAEKIADNSNNNLRQSIRSFEASWQKNYPFGKDQILTGWEDDITNIAKKIIEEQSPKQLYIIRGKLQNLIEHDVSLDFIFKSLVEELKKQFDVGLHHCIDTLYEEYNRGDGDVLDIGKPFIFARSRQEEIGKKLNDPVRKNVQHFLRMEEFIAKFMSWCKTKVMNNKCERQETTTS